MGNLIKGPNLKVINLGTVFQSKSWKRKVQLVGSRVINNSRSVYGVCLGFGGNLDDILEEGVGGRTSTTVSETVEYMLSDNLLVHQTMCI